MSRTEASSNSAKELSIVVPCYEEQDNVRPLCTRIFKACKKAELNVEVILVDDYSGEGSELTKKEVEKLQNEGYKVQLVVRVPEEGIGLSSAVVLGFSMAKFDSLLCMDADLQHEPESVPAVSLPVREGHAEFSVGSRNVEGGSAEFSVIRRIVSVGATMMAYPISRTTDPMSGFFCISKKAFQRGKDILNPMGYKIGLELMVRCNCDPVLDVPIQFKNREAGESKLTMKTNVYYALHVLNLYWFKYPMPIIVFIVSLLWVVFH